MSKQFKIVFKENQKYGKSIERNAVVTIAKATNDIGIDAKSALNTFISSFGSLKKNEIIEILELDEEGNQVGEPIRPVADTNIVPVRRKGN